MGKLAKGVVEVTITRVLVLSLLALIESKISNV